MSEIEIILTKIKENPSKQLCEDGIFVNGFKLKGARLNEQTGLLEEEGIREFDYTLPSFYLSFKKRERCLIPIVTPNNPYYIINQLL